MRSKVLILIVGIFIGWLVFKIISPSESTNKAKHQSGKTHQVHKDTISAKTKRAALSLPTKRIEKKLKSPSSYDPPETVIKSPVAQAAIKSEKSLVILPLNETNVTLLEKQWYELRQYAYSTRTRDGWKIHLLETPSIFSTIGFHDGDVITHESLMGPNISFSLLHLAQRIVTILKKIER